MRINLSGHHVEVSESLRRYIEGKMSRIERHFDHVVDVTIVLAVEKLRHKAEATIRVAGNNLHAESEHDDMYAAIDLMIDKLDRQVRKHKEKKTDHRQREGGLKTQQIG
jgi:putative sigma-54 modulation protein